MKNFYTRSAVPGTTKALEADQGQQFWYTGVSFYKVLYAQMFACCCGKDDEAETDLVSDLDLAVERRRHSRSASICHNQVQVNYR